MEWKVPFVVFRPRGNGEFDEVFQTGDFKKAKYWLTYIAQKGDVLCRTPNHPKHSGGDEGMPEYWSHKNSTGAVASDEDQFLTNVIAGQSCAFPLKPAKDADSYRV
jgi:hypothetical protein